MRIVLKNNQTFDDVSYLKNDEFTLRAVKWGDDGIFRYLCSRKTQIHTADASMFDIDCRDTK